MYYGGDLRKAKHPKRIQFEVVFYDVIEKTVVSDDFDQ